VGITMFVPQEVWVTANFKETQLDLMRAGQPVDIAVDAFPDRAFRGHVDSIQAGSGTAFSLLPAENATGNYIKVVQRTPVKIAFDEMPDVQLGPGMSVVPWSSCDDRRTGRWLGQQPICGRGSQFLGLIATVVSIATFMQVLDTSIANVALRQSEGSLGAGADESTWIVDYVPRRQRHHHPNQWLAVRRCRPQALLVESAIPSSSSYQHALERVTEFFVAQDSSLIAAQGQAVG
jgi:hypothetical protein